MKIQCCKCKRVRVENRWAIDTGREPEAVSHTYCPTCFEAARREMSQLQSLHSMKMMEAS